VVKKNEFSTSQIITGVEVPNSVHDGLKQRNFGPNAPSDKPFAGNDLYLVEMLAKLGTIYRTIG
jgi:hypothetical protein